MAEREYLIAPWIRLWHWTNAALILTLGVTGLSLHFASPDLPLVDFALAVRIHNTAGVLLIVTYLGFDFGSLMGGAIVTERIFNIQGIGGYIFHAISTKDGTAVVGTITFLVIVFLVMNLIVDLLYGALDPRIGHE